MKREVKMVYVTIIVIIGVVVMYWIQSHITRVHSWMK